MNKIKNILVVSLCSLSLSGCGLYSKYQRPTDMEFTDSLYNYIEITNDTTNIANIAWKELFTDKYLQRLISQALENNTDLNVARLSVEQAEMALKTARLSFLPSLSFDPYGKVSSFDGESSKSYNLSASASWEIDVFGRLRNAKEGSKAAFERSNAYKQLVQTQLIATIANSYYSLLMLDAQLEITTATRKNWTENNRSMKALKEAGRVDETSVLQSTASVISLNSSIVTLEQQIKELENTISVLLAVSPQHIERGKIKDIEFPEELAVGVPMQLLSNRPDVRVAEYNLAEAFYAVNEARASLYPKITLSGSAGYTNSNGAIVNPGDMLYSLIGSLSQTIFNAGSLRTQVKISDSQREQAQLEFKQTLLDAGAEVNSALISWQSARKRIEYDKSSIKVLKRAVNTSEQLMVSGRLNYLDVLTARNTLLQSELSYLTNKYGEIQGVINLYRSLGGGLK